MSRSRDFCLPTCLSACLSAYLSACRFRVPARIAAPYIPLLALGRSSAGVVRLLVRDLAERRASFFLFPRIEFKVNQEDLGSR